MIMLKMKVRCKNCGYEWETKSQMVLVSCSSCGNKVRVRDTKNAERLKTLIRKKNINERL